MSSNIPQSGFKRCSKCQQEKPLDQFHKDKYQEDGYRIFCKQCVKENRKNQYMCQECKQVFKEEETEQAYNGFRLCIHCAEKFRNKKRCSKCRKIKDLSEFGESTGRRDGYHYYCKDCRREIDQTARQIRLQSRGIKHCLSCKKIKDLSEFNVNLASRDKLQLCCKECEEARRLEKKQGHDREYKECEISKAKERKLRSLYGITIDDYRRLYEQQQGLCAICGRPELKRSQKMLCVDHDHTTGKIRALLCNNCNTGLGAFEENPEYLLKAAQYLQQHIVPKDPV